MTEKESPIVMDKKQEKSKQQILAERQAKKAAKKQGKSGELNVTQVMQPVEKTSNTDMAIDKTSVRKENNKPVKQTGSQKVVADSKPVEIVKTSSDLELASKMENLHITEGASTKIDEQKTKTFNKAERRAIQEAQRAAKAKQQQETIEKQQKKVEKSKEVKVQKSLIIGNVAQKSAALHKVRLFKHLYTEKCDLRIKANSRLHPAIIKLGAQYGNDSIVGSNSRCYAFLNAMKTVRT